MLTLPIVRQDLVRCKAREAENTEVNLSVIEGVSVRPATQQMIGDLPHP